LDNKIFEFNLESNQEAHEKSIYLVVKEGLITEVNGRRKFCIQFDDSQIQEYEKRMLSDASCPYTLPMSFLSDDGITKAWYDYTGYIQLKEYIRSECCNSSILNNRKPIYEAMDILFKIMQNLRASEDYLILPDRVSLDPDTIFINPSHLSISFAFYPNEVPELTFQERLFHMINKISSWYQNDEVDHYNERFLNMVREKNLGLEGTISVLCTIQRELSYIYCNTSHLRKQAEIQDKYAGIENLETDDKLEVCNHSGLSGVIKRKFRIK